MTGIHQLSPGPNAPYDVHVVIEISQDSGSIKYEIDKDSGLLMVDRYLKTSMHYPCDYGFIPKTLSEDGDPVDVLVVSPFKIQAGAVTRARPIGLLRMTDESGKDAKILAVPVTKLTPCYQHIQSPHDLGEHFLSAIKHFFEHYKDLDVGKWVKIEDWEEAASAHQEILDSIQRYQNS